MIIDKDKSDFNKTIVPWIGKTSKMMNMHISDIFQKNKIPLTKQQWIVLKLLHDDGDGLIQNELAFITNRNKASLTRLISGMEKNGYVKRVSSEKDSRKKNIYITRKGKELFLKTKPILLSCIYKIQNNISENELENFMKVMLKIQNNLQKHEI